MKFKTTYTVETEGTTFSRNIKRDDFHTHTHTHKMENKIYLDAIELADQYMSMDPEAGNVTSCLKQAASDCGIEWGEMGKFIAWAHDEFGL